MQKWGNSAKTLNIKLYTWTGRYYDYKCREMMVCSPVTRCVELTDVSPYSNGRRTFSLDVRLSRELTEWRSNEHVGEAFRVIGRQRGGRRAPTPSCPLWLSPTAPASALGCPSAAVARCCPAGPGLGPEKLSEEQRQKDAGGKCWCGN